MKRIISAVLVLLALGVAAFFFIKLRRFLPERARAAELAPADTVLFLQVPNLRETAFRVPGLDLYAIWMEPDVQAFLEKPRRKSPWMREWQERYEDVVRVAPGEMFVAFTELGERPEFVGGFSFAGSRQAAEALVERAHGSLPGRLAMKPHAHWMFFATNDAALNAAIERYDGAGGGPAIGGDPAFQQAIQALGVPQDFVLYGRANSLPALPALPALLPGTFAKATNAALATKIEKGKLHDTIFIPAPPAAPAGATQQTLALTSAQTLLYSTSELPAWPGGAELGMVKTLFPQLAAAEKSLAARGLSWADLPAAFGPEIGAIVEWPEAAALPSLVLAPQIRDLAKAQQFLEGITAPAEAGTPWPVQEINGVKIYTAPASGVPFLQPTVALTDRFALAALSSAALTTALERLKTPVPTLATSPGFQDATRFIATTPSSLAYLDFPHLFERVYRLTRPFITLSLAFSPEAGAQVDAGKLPPVEAISRHLSPLVITQARHEAGLLIESTGSITFTEMMLGAGVGALTGSLPSLPGQIRGLVPGRSLLPDAPPATTPPPAAPTGESASGEPR